MIDIRKIEENPAKVKELLANKLYDLDLIWKSKTSKDNDDDISDAILIAHTVIHK